VADFRNYMLSSGVANLSVAAVDNGTVGNGAFAVERWSYYDGATYAALRENSVELNTVLLLAGTLEDLALVNSITMMFHHIGPDRNVIQRTLIQTKDAYFDKTRCELRTDYYFLPPPIDFSFSRDDKFCGVHQLGGNYFPSNIGDVREFFTNFADFDHDNLDNSFALTHSGQDYYVWRTQYAGGTIGNRAFDMQIELYYDSDQKALNGNTGPPNNGVLRFLLRSSDNGAKQWDVEKDPLQQMINLVDAVRLSPYFTRNM